MTQDRDEHRPAEWLQREGREYARLVAARRRRHALQMAFTVGALALASLGLLALVAWAMIEAIGLVL